MNLGGIRKSTLKVVEKFLPRPTLPFIILETCILCFSDANENSLYEKKNRRKKGELVDSQLNMSQECELAAKKS